MARSIWRLALIVALRLVITFLFVPAILVKFRNPVAWGDLFVTWGYPYWGPAVVSSIEVFALVALWIPKASRFAIAALMITTAGATGTWLIHGPRNTAAYPAIILVMLVGLARAARRQSSARDPV